MMFALIAFSYFRFRRLLVAFRSQRRSACFDLRFAVSNPLYTGRNRSWAAELRAP
jgi:hypothetical protein